VKHGVAFSHLQGWKTVRLLPLSLIETGHASTPIVGSLPNKHQEIVMQGIKGLIVLSAAVVAVALGACRREEAAPMKLGAEVPAATEVAR
jgi:hypothetical protein